MASIIVGSAILISYAVHERKEKKREKARLAEELYSPIHGKPTLVGTRQQRKQQQVVVPDLPSYESVVSGREELSNIRTSNEKERRISEDSTRRE